MTNHPTLTVYACERGVKQLTLRASSPLHQYQHYTYVSCAISCHFSHPSSEVV